MALKQCETCSEMVDEAKAFCPGCGHALIAEQERKQESSFDSMAHTVQLGDTMYNQMLSDMGLKGSKTPIPPEKRVEIIAPLTPAAKPRAVPDIKSKPASNKKWYILAGVIFFVLSLLVIAIAAVVFLF